MASVTETKSMPSDENELLQSAQQMARGTCELSNRQTATTSNFPRLASAMRRSSAGRLSFAPVTHNRAGNEAQPSSVGLRSLVDSRFQLVWARLSQCLRTVCLDHSRYSRSFPESKLIGARTHRFLKVLPATTHRYPASIRTLKEPHGARCTLGSISNLAPSQPRRDQAGWVLPSVWRSPRIWPLPRHPIVCKKRAVARF